MYVLPPRGPTWAARSDFRTPWRFAQNVAKPVLWMKDERVRNVGTFAKPATEFSTVFFSQQSICWGNHQNISAGIVHFFLSRVMYTNQCRLGPPWPDLSWHDCETEAHSPWHVPWDHNCRVRGRNCCFRLNWLVILFFFFWFYINKSPRAWLFSFLLRGLSKNSNVSRWESHGRCRSTTQMSHMSTAGLVISPWTIYL